MNKRSAVQVSLELNTQVPANNYLYDWHHIETSQAISWLMKGVAK